MLGNSFAFFGNGVDLFFALSGYLITGILLDSKGRRGYFSVFYARRTLRIFPLYYGVLLVVFGTLGIIRMSGVELSAASEDAWRRQGWLWGYANNFSLGLLNYTHSPTYISLAHFWSLACEEQFYIIWPTLVFLVSRRMLIGVCGAGMLALCTVRFALDAMGSSAGYRIASYDGLFFGAMLAALSRPGDRPAASVWHHRLPLLRKMFYITAAIGLAMLVIWRAAEVIPSLKRPYLAIKSLMPLPVVLAFGIMILLAVHSPVRSRFRRFFESPLLVFFGKYSYALYVFHYMLLPLMTLVLLEHGIWRFTRSVATMPLFIILAIAISIAAALLSWNLLEKPMLKLKRNFRYG